MPKCKECSEGGQSHCEHDLVICADCGDVFCRVCGKRWCANQCPYYYNSYPPVHIPCIWVPRTPQEPWIWDGAPWSNAVGGADDNMSQTSCNASELVYL